MKTAALLLLALLLAGCDLTPAATPTPVVIVVTATPAPVLPTFAPTNQPTPAPASVETPTRTAGVVEQPIMLQGNGEQSTAPFILAGGNYVTTWTATNNDIGSGCPHAGTLRSVTNTRISQELFNLLVQGAQQGSTSLYNVQAGQYYVEIGSSCPAWTITIQPQTP